MGKNKSNKDKRVEFKLSSFFVDKLKFEDNKLYFGSNNKLSEVANLIGFDVNRARKFLKINSRDNTIILNDDQIAELAFEKKIDFIKVDDISEINILKKINRLLKDNFIDRNDVVYKRRAPIVTIMGHVDHGKTTLLDAIRNSNVTKGEVGGITQSIGAYQIVYDDKEITFIDTPGHEAFTRMRAQGSKLTDIAVIVVAADDSIMPQTKESIDHAKEAKVPIIIAINKVDRPGVNIEKVKQELTSYDIIPIEWGGDVPFVEISALKNKNIDKLLETIINVSKVVDLEVPYNIFGSGTIIESNVSKKQGNLVHAIVLNGTIKVSDNILIDDQYLRIKGIIDEHGNRIQEAYPGIPVEIYGLGFSPEVGTNFVVSLDKKTQKMADIISVYKKNVFNQNLDIENPFLIFQNSSLLSKKTIKIILKADSIGMLNALEDQINAFSNNDVEIKVIRKDIGELTNTDVSLAETAGALIYQFNLKIPGILEQEIRNRKIHVLSFDIIYKLLEDLEEKIKNQKPKKFNKEKIGEAEILEKFVISKIGAIAGTRITKGFINNDSYVKIFRKEKFIDEKKVSSLKIEKNNVKIVKKGQECGIMLENFSDFEIGDTLEIFELVEENK